MSGTGIHINIVYTRAGLADKSKFRSRVKQPVVHFYLINN